MTEGALETVLCFPTYLYKMSKPIYFERLSKVCAEALAENRNGVDDVYPVKMSGDISQDARIQDFCEYVAKTSLNILMDQGYDIANKVAYFESMWCQEHHKHSMMEQHVHPGDVQIVGFYFLDAPDNCSLATFYEPRSGKVQGGRPEANISEVTYASNAFHVKPEAGQLVLTNSWLPHSFTRQRSEKPFRFVHFNICLTDALPSAAACPAAEVV